MHPQQHAPSRRIRHWGWQNSAHLRLSPTATTLNKLTHDVRPCICPGVDTSLFPSVTMQGIARYCGGRHPIFTPRAPSHITSSGAASWKMSGDRFATIAASCMVRGRAGCAAHGTVAGEPNLNCICTLPGFSRHSRVCQSHYNHPPSDPAVPGRTHHLLLSSPRRAHRRSYLITRWVSRVLH